MAGRTFAIRPAVRESVPLLIGIVGPSGSGKTFSALRLATGIQRVQPGPIVVIDTEANRAKFYADRFKFDHVSFGAPFSPLDYLACIEACVAHGARTIIVDSMSHEHEGPGGVLEWAQREAETMSERSARNGRRRPPESFTMPSYAAPKAARRRMLNTIIQLGCNLIMCFRAKEKTKMPDRDKGEDKPTFLGWQPIAGEEIVYETVTQFLLLPGSDGVPCYAPEHAAERDVVKRPEFFRKMLERPEQLSEDLGERMARWASGEDTPSDPERTPSRASTETTPQSLCQRVAAARSMDELLAVERGFHGIKFASVKMWLPVKNAVNAKRAELEASPEEPHDPAPEVDAEPTHNEPDGYRPDFE